MQVKIHFQFALLLFFTMALLPIKAEANSADFNNNRVVQVVEKAIPSVVFIANKSNPFDLSYDSNPNSYYEYLRPIYEWFWPPQIGHGSGFITTPDGYVITNAHVVEGGTDFLIVLHSGENRICKAHLVGSDPRTDIAVLKIDNPQGIAFPYLSFGDSNKTNIGDAVIAIGNPLLAELSSTVTMGIVSGTNRSNFGVSPIEGHIQTDAAINFGNSGGPMLNLQGKVIGMATWGIGGSFSEGLSFGVPSNAIQEVSRQLISRGEVLQGYLGIELENGKEAVFDTYYFNTNDGARIKRVFEDSPAEYSGLEKGDLIIQMNHQSIQSAENLSNKLWLLEPKTKIDLTIDRRGSIIEISVELKAKGVAELFSWLSFVGGGTLI